MLVVRLFFIGPIYEWKVTRCIFLTWTLTLIKKINLIIKITVSTDIYVPVRMENRKIFNITKNILVKVERPFQVLAQEPNVVDTNNPIICNSIVLANN